MSADNGLNIIDNENLFGRYISLTQNNGSLSILLSIARDKMETKVECTFRGVYFIKLELNTIPSEIYLFSSTEKDETYWRWINQIQIPSEWEYYILKFDVESVIRVLCREVTFVPKII